MTKIELLPLYREIFDFLFEILLQKRREGEDFEFHLSPQWDNEHEIRFLRGRLRLSFLYLTENTFKPSLKLDVTCHTEEEGRSEEIKKYMKSESTIEELKKIFGFKFRSESRMTEITRDNLLISYTLIYTDYEEQSIKENLFPFLQDFIDNKKPKVAEYFKEWNFSMQRSEMERNILVAKEKWISEKYTEKYKNLEAEYSFRLLDIFVRDFRGIKNLAIEDIPANTQWIFLTGENGYGKTTILQAILLSLFGSEEEKNDTNAHKDAVLEAIVLDKEKKVTANLSYGMYGQNISFNYVPRSFKNHIVAFGSERLLTSIDGISVTGSLMGKENGKLKAIDSELYKMGINPDNPTLYPRFTLLKNTLCKFIPHLKDIHADGVERKTIYTEQDEEGNELPPVTFDKLAAGFKSMINLIGNIVLRLASDADNQANPELLSGVVIIDEIDLHLHPKMQRFLVEKLTALFPKVQFIVSTHSPIPLLGAPKETVILHVDRNAEEGITVEKLAIDWENFTPDVLFSSPIFDFKTITPKSHNQSLGVRTEYTYDETLLNDEVNRRINARSDKYKSIFGKS